MNTTMKAVLGATALLLAGAFAPRSALRPAAADPDVDVSIFFGALAPQGDWVQVQPYGWAWVPDAVEPGWQPYTVGQWAWIDTLGWTWVSEEPWGWATYHYGRWIYVEDYGWAWLPGTVWAPAWVVFRFGDPWVGWAPLPPGPSWRFDAGFDVAGLNVDVNVGTYAWSFVPLRYFAEPDVHSHVLVTAYNPYLVQRTRPSTRYEAVRDGIANFSVDVATVEKARGAPVQHRKLRELPALDKGSGTKVEGDAVVVYKPRIAAKAPTLPTPPRTRGDGSASKRVDVDAWTARNQAALKAHLEAQRKALEQQDSAFGKPTPPPPGMGSDDDTAKRREAAMKALEDERKRLEALLERRRKRLEELAQQPPPPPPPAMDDHRGMDDDGHGMGDDHGMK